jgi:hypothetical protein
VKNCIGIADFLCAYADNELPEANRKLVEDHLVICENCSAILKVYSEISVTIDETNVPAPDALLLGVMNRIQSESTPRAAAKKKLISQNRTRLMRYMPIAAGLVVMLLVWQFQGDSFLMRNFGASEAGAMPNSATLLLQGQQAAAPAPAAVEAESDDSVADGLDEPHTRIGDQSYGIPEPATPGGGAAVVPTLVPPEHPILQGITRTSEETEQIMDYIGGASTVITIVGELPAMLANIEPQSFGSWFGWEMVFEIPDTDVQTLLEQLINRPEVVVVRHENNNSTYAVVFFNPEE